ncbi:tripartite tricarboxylate transporter TctB family protein [Halomonas sp. HP20-15]|uniref:tripartite tricarboxylate transporter TctB family protein n=1 Tax=Halomonas sp. HP20-15 TaxID=3085901 RepID=UPI0029813CF8|nr:tripartite tricarboxylate transporter TctB family protein [Halomonas sp. HP20-15]MDW5376692.1 tripartite tricarboxylate transporter TctB family protein [Halomonas sp. HP20-15]
MRLNDRIFGLLMFVLAVAYGWGAQQFPEPFGGSEAVGPETFPTILSVVLALSSIYLIVKPDPSNAWPKGQTAVEILIAIGTLIAYILILEPLGFIVATMLAVGTLCWRMGARVLPGYLTGLLGGIVVFALFNYVLELPLPLGILSFLEAS